MVTTVVEGVAVTWTLVIDVGFVVTCAGEVEVHPANVRAMQRMMQRIVPLSSLSFFIFINIIRFIGANRIKRLLFILELVNYIKLISITMYKYTNHYPNLVKQ